MIRGLYTSGWSMLALQKKMDIVTNNMANASTSGYKKDTLVLESFPSLLTKIVKDYGGTPGTSRDIGTMELGNDVGEVFTNYTQGQITKTNNNLDMAIRDSNNAFFTVSMTDADGNENEYYTRDGSFTKGSDGSLLTSDGYPVLGKNGPIKLGSGDFIVGSDGTVQQNGVTVDQLRITEFADTTQLKKFGNNLISADANAATEPFAGIVEQGATELSNVNIIKEMVDMITVTRAYEANQKVLQAQDGTLDKAVNEVGRV
jgi:flagellar basal-body rod protein FlgF